MTDLGIAGDTEGAVAACFERALHVGANVIISSGGVSMGDRDFVKPVLERSGTVHFGKARPLMHWHTPNVHSTDTPEHR